MVVSMGHLRFSVRAASTAMKGFRAALASTGVGLLVVGIGMLVGYMMSLGDETSETTMQMNRLHRSFEKDLMKVTELNVENTERVDLLRKLNQDYPELIGNIDLETASNTQLLNVLRVINSTRAERTLIAQKQELIDKIFEAAAAETLVYERSILTLEAQKEATKMSQGQLFVHNSAIKSNQKAIDGIMKKARAEEAAHLADINVFMSMIKRKQQASGTWRTLDMEEENKHRTKLSKEYLADLEAFRKIASDFEKASDGKTRKQIARMKKEAKAKQQLEIDNTNAEMAAIEKKIKFHEIYKRVGVGTSKQVKATSKEMLKFTEDMSKSEIKDMKKVKSLNLLGIQVQEMRKKVVKLNYALMKSGPALDDKSALGTHKLNTTKDRIKELLKLRVESIVEIEEREKRGIEVGFEAQMEKYTKEAALILANEQTIAQYMEGTASNQDALNQDFINKNKSKYDVLKNLDALGWDLLNESSATGIAKRKAMLNDMYLEEITRKGTNAEIILAIDAAQDRELAVLANDQATRKLGHQKKALQTQMSQLDSGFESIFRSNKEHREKLTEHHDKDIELNAERVTLGEITAEEGAANRLAIEKNLSDELNALEDKRLEKVKEVYGQISGVIMDISANRAAVESQRVEDNFTRDTQIEQDKFDRQLQIAEKAGKDTEGMQKKHDIKMRALEEQKSNDLREIARKQFVMKKANDLMMAAINGALAITKVTAQTGVGAIAAVPLTAALIGAQIAAIASRQFVGEQGGITPSLSSEGSLNKFASGGMVVGPSHAQGGVKFSSGGRVSELEGGEAVINKRSTAMFKPMLSQMNSHNGYGKKFAQGGLTPGMRSTMESTKDNWSANDIAGLISGSINSQQVFVTEADISSSQSVVDIIEGHSSIF